MKIVYINTDNKIIARDTIVRKAIEANMQYVEMDEEILIEDKILFRINEQHINKNHNLPIILEDIFEQDDKRFSRFDEIMAKDQILVIHNVKSQYCPLGIGIKPNKKAELRRNSKLVKTKLNKNEYYKKRGK